MFCIKGFFGLRYRVVEDFNIFFVWEKVLEKGVFLYKDFVECWKFYLLVWKIFVLDWVKVLWEVWDFLFMVLFFDSCDNFNCM